MRKTLLIAVMSFTVGVMAFGGSDQFTTCEAEGHAPDVCAACLNPSRGSGTAGSTAVCLCMTEQEKLGQAAFDATYGDFGKCVQLEHSHGIQ